MRVWEQNNYLKSPIRWFQAGVDLGAASWRVTRLESRCESARCENRAPLVVGSFLLTCPLLTWLTAIRRCCKQVLNHIYLAKKLFYFLNGEVTKNRTLTKPSCQVRRLSKLKPACLTLSCSFVCSVTKRVPSFVEAWLCHAHGCTFLALLPMPSPNPLAWQ